MQIYVNTNLLNDINMLKITIGHEFQHALQIKQGMTQGFSSSFLYDMNKKQPGKVKTIVADIKKHVPNIFDEYRKTVDGKTRSDIDIAQMFLYNASYGELMATNNIKIT